MSLRLANEEDRPDPVSVAGRSVDGCCPPLVVAELGVNHDGRPDQALALAAAAHEAGADAVKLQVFRSEQLARADAPPAAYQSAAVPCGSQRELLAALELTPRDLARIADRCRELGILFLGTPFSPDDLEVLCALQPAAIKIASTDVDNLPLLQAAAATGRSILLSTGASTLEEIAEAVDWLDQLGAGQRLVLMHCTSSYPTAPQDAALSTIRALQARFQRWIGFSDHTPDVDIAGLAVACGACILEKHLTFDRRGRGPDHAVSLTPEEFKLYVDSARRAWRMLGRPRTGVLPAEQDVRQSARRSIVAREHIPAGQVLTTRNLALRRPAGGLPPANWPSLLGRCAAQDIAADTPIAWNMVR